MADIHKYSDKVQNKLQAIKSNPDINHNNTEAVKEFVGWLTERELSDSRIYRYLASAKKVMEHNDFCIHTADKNKIRKLHRQIQNSEYYHKEYSPETKKEYKKFLRTFYKWANDTDEVPDKAKWLSTTVDESVKERTRPDELPTIEDIKTVCQRLNGFKYKAAYLLHWELGSRIGETLNLKMRDVDIADESVSVTVPGNKESDDRYLELFIAKPAIKIWIDRHHPDPNDTDAYLFPKKQPGATDDTDNPLYQPASYDYLHRRLRRLADKLDIDREITKTHHVRKKRITFLKAVLGVPESVIDARVGHVPGSDVTREYLRLDDSDVNKKMREAYGIEETEPDEQDLLPLQCTECGLINPGWRDRCIDCNELLDIREIEQESDDIVDKVFDQLKAVELAGNDIDIENQEDLIRELVRDQLEG